MNKIFELQHTKPNLTMTTIMITQRNPKLFTQKKPNETLLCKSVTSVCQFQIKFEFAGFSR